MKALIAVSASREWVESDFLMQMGRFIIPAGWQVRFGWFKQFTAAHRHNVAAWEAKYNYDRLLFMDTDQIYPHDYIVRMLEHKEPVVTALNVSRYTPFEHTIYNIEGEHESGGETIPQFKSIKPPTDKTIFECDMTGTGSLILDPSILDRIKVPFFKDVFNNDGTLRLLPDDFYFCWLLYKAGIKVTVDQSIIVQHISKVTASPYNTMEMQLAWEKVNSGWGITKDGVKA